MATVTKRQGSALWEAAPTEFSTTSTLLHVYGDTGTGKSTLALTAPGPIAYMHAAEKIVGIVEPFARKKDVRLYNFGATFPGGNPQATAKAANEVWMRMCEAWYDAYGWARTIVWDTHDEGWELIRLARFGGLKPTGGRVDANYGPVNAEFKALFKRFREQDRANVILIGHTKDEYVKSKTTGGSEGMGQRTGNTIVAGQKDVVKSCDVSVRMRKDFDDDGSLKFFARIEKGWMNAQVEGIELEDDMATFSEIMSIVTGLEAEEWSR